MFPIHSKPFLNTLTRYTLISVIFFPLIVSLFVTSIFSYFPISLLVLFYLDYYTLWLLPWVFGTPRSFPCARPCLPSLALLPLPFCFKRDLSSCTFYLYVILSPYTSLSLNTLSFLLHNFGFPCIYSALFTLHFPLSASFD